MRLDLVEIGRFGILSLLALSLVLARCGSIGASSLASSISSATTSIAKAPTTTNQDKPSTPDTEAVKESDLGLSFYPGSMHGDESLTTDDTVHTKNIKVRQFSEDQPDKIIDFYKQKLKPAKGTFQAARNTNSAESSSQGFDGEMANEKGRVTVDAVRKKSETRTEINISVESINAK